jgi:hypothetical protein
MDLQVCDSRPLLRKEMEAAETLHHGRNSIEWRRTYIAARLMERLEGHMLMTSIDRRPQRPSQFCRTGDVRHDSFPFCCQWYRRSSMAELFSRHASVGTPAKPRQHSRLTKGYSLLKRGGWVQITEWDFSFRSDSANSDALQALQEWSRLYAESLSRTTRPEGRKRARVVQDCESWMRMAGFINVSTDVRDVPTCPWPTGRLFLSGYPGRSHGYKYRLRLILLS